MSHQRARIVTNQQFRCQRTHTKVHFMVQEVPLHHGEGGTPQGIAYVPSCTGSRFCGAFPNGLPKKIADVPITTKTGCAFFDSRITGGIESHHGHD